jgi:hypothetical protein
MLLVNWPARATLFEEEEEVVLEGSEVMVPRKRRLLLVRYSGGISWELGMWKYCMKSLCLEARQGFLLR